MQVLHKDILLRMCNQYSHSGTISSYFSQLSIPSLLSTFDPNIVQVTSCLYVCVYGYKTLYLMTLVFRHMKIEKHAHVRHDYQDMCASVND